MVDPLTTQIGVGGAVAVLLVGTVMKFLPTFMAALKAQNGTKNGTGAKSGDRSVDEWEGRMRELHMESEERIMRNVRDLLDAKNDKVRQIVREELSKR